ncbi:MAG: hypothetical protein IKO35_07055, partial [Elusimicrobiaceae bacterium]|nr:hypothetical protein [Elusimicrobiaceae bacterium]
VLLLGIVLNPDSPAQTVGKITANAVRMSPDTLIHRFEMKPGEEFSQDRYEKAQENLHKLRVFKKLEFVQTEHAGLHDIHIRAQDGYYIFPLAFIMGGSKNAAGASLAAGNLFKQAESLFLFGGGSKSGLTVRGGLLLGDHFITAAYTQLHFDQNFYTNHWFNTYDVFSTTDEDNHSNQLLRSIRSRQDKITLLYRYRFSRTGQISLAPQYNRITYAHQQLDSGNHHQVTAALTFAEDIRPDTNMGALAGYGLTDKAKSLQDLPQARQGYSGKLAYTQAGTWSGSDYTVSKLALEGTWLLELRSHHMFMVQLHAQNAFKAPFSDQVTSTDVLTEAGKYDRQRRGKRAAGAGASFAYYILRNQTGLLSVAPFYEISYTETDGSYRPHSGAGINLFYRLWRFPLPLGLNYTHNLQDGSHQIGFVVGGAF